MPIEDNMTASNHTRPCLSCHSPLGWLATECPSCGYEFSAAEMRGAAMALEMIADGIARRYEPGTAENAAYLADVAERERCLNRRGTAHQTVLKLPEPRRRVFGLGPARRVA
jgi:hypothetical protein